MVCASSSILLQLNYLLPLIQYTKIKLTYLTLLTATRILPDVASPFLLQTNYFTPLLLNYNDHGEYLQRSASSFALFSSCSLPTNNAAHPPLPFRLLSLAYSQRSASSFQLSFSSSTQPPSCLLRELETQDHFLVIPLLLHAA